MSDILVERKGEVEWITMNRPERMNAYDASMAKEMIDAVDGAADAGVLGDDRSISSAAHKARVCVWRIEDAKKVVSVRRDAAGSLVGGPVPADLTTRIARQRQANSCALALSVREALGDDSAARVPE